MRCKTTGKAEPFFFAYNFQKHLTMKENIQIFSNPQFGEIRTSISANDEPLFCLADVTKALGLDGGARNVKSRLKDRGVVTVNTPTQNQYGTVVFQQMNYIDEPNLYRCIFQSRKKEAEQFQDWVVEEILPSIRKSGGYLTSHADESPEEIMARALVVAQQTIERSKQQLQMAQGTIDVQQEQIKVLTPKADYTDKVLQSTDVYRVNQIAKELGMSAVSLNRKLQERGVQYNQSGQWVLTAKYHNRGYTKTITTTYEKEHFDGSVTTHSSILTVWTERGRAFIHWLFDAEQQGKQTIKVKEGA